EVLARRPQVQERMTEELADLLMEQLDARGVGVIIEATHTCMTIRGIRKADSVCTTSAMRGAFRTNQSTRAELMALVYGSRGSHACDVLFAAGLRDGGHTLDPVAGPSQPTLLPRAVLGDFGPNSSRRFPRPASRGPCRVDGVLSHHALGNHRFTCLDIG